MGNRRWFESSPSQLPYFFFFQLFNIQTKRHRSSVIKQLSVHKNLVLRFKSVKFSFLFIYLVKKKNTLFNMPVDFLFFNNLYLLLLKKVSEILTIYETSILFLADEPCNLSARINDLNFFNNKKKYIYFKLKKNELIAINNSFLEHGFFVFLFVVPLNNRLMYLHNYSNVCPLIGYNFVPTFFNFFLPTLVDFNFSLFFYKYFFYNFLKNIFT